MNYCLRYETSCKWALSGLLMVKFLSFSHFLPLSTKKFSQKMDGKCMTQLGSTEDRWVLFHILPQPLLLRSEGLCSNIITGHTEWRMSLLTNAVQAGLGCCSPHCSDWWEQYSFRDSGIHWWTSAQVPESWLQALVEKTNALAWWSGAAGSEEWRVRVPCTGIPLLSFTPQCLLVLALILFRFSCLKQQLGGKKIKYRIPSLS